jgi:acetamidase/formamidase
MTKHFLDRDKTVNRWNNAYPPRLFIDPGDTVTMAMKDASDGQVSPGMSAEEFAKIDTTRIHSLTGPIAIAGAEPGDHLAVDILDYEHEGWAWTSIIPGLGLLADDFRQHFLFHWKLEGTQTHSFPGVTLELNPFAGIIGVQRAESGEFRTRPPGLFGGNMDVKHLTAGSTLLLPVFTSGGLLCAGDCHAAQGDGEVSINGMEAPMRMTLRVNLRKGQPLEGPEFITPGPLVPSRYAAKPWRGFIASDPDVREACKTVVRRAIDFIMKRLGVSPEEAYILCSVVLDLKISQLVNIPMITVTGYLPMAIFND